MPLLCIAAAVAVSTSRAQADNFQSVAYDASRDELVIVVLYRGTNPDHQFSLRWGPCMDHGEHARSIIAELLDQQHQDPARVEYSKTIRMSLAGVDCRPAVVTLRTAPGFNIKLRVPARSSGT